LWCRKKDDKGVNAKFADGLSGFFCRRHLWEALDARAQAVSSTTPPPAASGPVPPPPPPPPVQSIPRETSSAQTARSA
jgi:hypothetical protein